MKLHVAQEHEFEAQFGLPEALPAGERILWQGAPEWRALARRVFHVNKVAVYFALMLAWRFGSVLSDGQGVTAALASLAWLVPLFGLALGALLLLARWTADTTAYTLTDKRIVMRIGIVLTVAYNLPLTRIEGAALHDGDIALALERGTRIAWLQLWPHARPWRVANPQPTLRGLRDAPAVSALLAQAWSQANGIAAEPQPAQPPRPAQRPQAVMSTRPAVVARHG
jgi:Bacterial PH domain